MFKTPENGLTVAHLWKFCRRETSIEHILRFSLPPIFCRFFPDAKTCQGERVWMVEREAGGWVTEREREREREGETKYYQSPSRTDVIMLQHNISASHPLHLIQYLPNICMKQDSENVRNLNFQLLLDHPWLAERIARLSLLGEGKRGVRVG